MFCTTCGKQVPPDTTTCPACGTRLPNQAAFPTLQSDQTQANTLPSPPAQPQLPPFPSPSPYPAQEQTYPAQEQPYGWQPQQTPSQPGWQPQQTPSQPGWQTQPQQTPSQPGWQTQPQQQPQPLPYYAQSPTPAPPTQSIPPIPPIPPTPAGTRNRRGLSKGVTGLLVGLALLVMISGFGLIYYSAIYHPNQLHAQATATVQAINTQDAHMTATANTEATGTAVAIANATATANAQATAQVAATATALANIYTQATRGTPAINDPLSSPNNWVDQVGTNGGGCSFTAGEYHINEPTTGYFLFCPAPNTNYGNCAFQVNIDMIAGDYAGIGIRANDTTGSAYYLTLYSDGSYDFSVWKDRNGSNSRSLQAGNATSIKSGHNQINTVTVIARNSTFYIYINQHFISATQDSSLSSGEIGLFAGDQTNAADVAFSNAKLWQL